MFYQDQEYTEVLAPCFCGKRIVDTNRYMYCDTACAMSDKLTCPDCAEQIVLGYMEDHIYQNHLGEGPANPTVQYEFITQAEQDQANAYREFTQRRNGYTFHRWISAMTYRHQLQRETDMALSAIYNIDLDHFTISFSEPMTQEAEQKCQEEFNQYEQDRKQRRAELIYTRTMRPVTRAVPIRCIAYPKRRHIPAQAYVRYSSENHRFNMATPL